MEEVINETKLQESVPAKPKRTIRGNTMVKIAAFILCVVCIMVTLLGVGGCFAILDYNMYGKSYEKVLKSALAGEAFETAQRVGMQWKYDGKETAVIEYLQQTNAQVAIKDPQKLNDDEVGYYWKSYQGIDEYSSLYVDTWGDVRNLSGYREAYAEAFPEEDPELFLHGDLKQVYRVFYNPSFPVKDDAYWIHLMVETIYTWRYQLPIFTCILALISLFLLIFLLSSAGHRNGREGIVPGVLTRWYTDVEAALFILLLCAWIALADESINTEYLGVLVVWATLPFVLILCIFYLMDLAIRIKLKIVLKHTLIYCLAEKLANLLRKACKASASLFSVMTVVEILVALLFCEGAGIVILRHDPDVLFVIWIFRSIFVAAFVLYLALCCRRLATAGEQLAEGKDDYCVDTSRMIGDMRRHGEHLNSIGLGINRAVEARLKSEHMKTELITNVTHDLKTPLTSIINYADLISNEKTDNPAITEYSEVLVRQSNRLKKLLDDLLEASKATTGNIEVNLEKCDAGVILSQAAAEYQCKMEDRCLEVRLSEPEEPVYIKADGRHLWRVFDNLLSNILKYAQDNTRVYLSLTKENGKAVITFRNISSYALELTAEELQERFVRGDKSRHMEGNGLGLSIAKSLVELQGGTMEINVDGDLFKVILTFREIS